MNTGKKRGRKRGNKRSWTVRVREDQIKSVMLSMRQNGCIDFSEWVDKILLSQSTKEQFVNALMSMGK